MSLIKSMYPLLVQEGRAVLEVFMGAEQGVAGYVCCKRITLCYQPTEQSEERCEDAKNGATKMR